MGNIHSIINIKKPLFMSLSTQMTSIHMTKQDAVNHQDSSKYLAVFVPTNFA